MPRTPCYKAFQVLMRFNTRSYSRYCDKPLYRLPIRRGPDRPCCELPQPFPTVSLRRQYPVLHPQDPVRRLRHLGIVGDDDDAAALLVGQAAEDVHDDAGVLPVQIAGWFVRQEDGSAGAQAPGDGQPLLPPAAEGGGETLVPVSKPFLPGPIKADRGSG